MFLANIATILALVEIYNSVLGSNGSFDTGSGGFATDGADLEIIALLRSTAAATKDATRIFFNADTTGANYVDQFLDAENTVVSGGTQSTAGPGILAANAPANSFTLFQVRIPDYAGNKLKNAEVRSYRKYDSASTAQEFTSYNIQWASTAAINRIRIMTDNDPTDLFAAGSSMRVIKTINRSILVP